MKKKIVFFTTRPPYKETRTVDLSKLSYTAMSMADQIQTTDMREAQSSVEIICKFTNREFYRRVVDNPEKYGEALVEQCKNNLDQIENDGDPWKIAEDHETAVYTFDALHKRETPEQYFERHAAILTEELEPNYHDATLRYPISILRYYRYKANLTQQELAEKSGVGKYQISRIERGDISVENITLANAAKLGEVLGIHAEDLLAAPENC